MTVQKEIAFNTRGHGDMHDLTPELQSFLQKSALRTGVANLFAVGSTAGICSIEFEPGLQKDLPEILNRLIPPGREYGHEQAWQDGNGHSHLQASLVGPDINIPVRNGKLVLGTWQQIVHVEFDIRNRNRSVIITLNGE